MKHRYRRKELILALEGLRSEVAGLKNTVRQNSKDLRALTELLRYFYKMEANQE